MKISEVINKQIKGLWGTDFSDIKNGTPVIKTNNMTYEGVIDYSDICYRNIKKDTIGDNYLQKGDLLVEKSGGTKTHSVGYVNFFDGDNDTFVCNNFIIGLRPNNEIVDSKYLFYQLRYMYECGYFSDCYNKTTGIQNLKANQYLEKNIRVESKNRQKSIADELDGIVEAINLKRKEVSFLDELVKSRFIEMFGDPISNPLGWEKVALSDVAEIKIGPFGSLLHKEDYIEHGHPLVNPSHIIDSSIATDSKLTISDSKYAELSSYHLKAGDVVLGRRGEMGRCAVVKKDGMLCGTGSLIIRANKDVTSEFIQNIISFPTYKEYIEGMAIGQTMLNLNVPIVSNLQIIKPPLDVQKQYYDLVKLTDKSKFVCRFTPSIFYAIFLHSRHPP